MGSETRTMLASCRACGGLRTVTKEPDSRVWKCPEGHDAQVEPTI
mgnify:CR=1 FL=1